MVALAGQLINDVSPFSMLTEVIAQGHMAVEAFKKQPVNRAAVVNRAAAPDWRVQSDSERFPLFDHGAHVTMLNAAQPAQVYSAAAVVGSSAE